MSEEIIETKIDDVQELGAIVTNWHRNALQQVAHILEMPEEAGIDIPTGTVDAAGNDEYIDGNEDHKAGYLAGMQHAFEILATFPIKGVPQDEQ